MISSSGVKMNTLNDIIKKYTFYINSLIEQRLIKLMIMGCECGETDDFTICYQEPYKFMYILCDNCKKKHRIKAIEEFQDKIAGYDCL